MPEVCRLLAHGRDTSRICKLAVERLMTRGVFVPAVDVESGSRRLARAWLTHVARTGFMIVYRIQLCRGGGRRHPRPLAGATVDPADPMNSPGFLLAGLAAKLRPWNGFCAAMDSLDILEPPSGWQHSKAAAILCRTAGPGAASERALTLCEKIVYNLVERGYVRPPPGRAPTAVYTRRLLAYLRDKGLLERRGAPLCEKPEKEVQLYTLSRRDGTKMVEEMKRLTLFPPNCI